MLKLSLQFINTQLLSNKQSDANAADDLHGRSKVASNTINLLRYASFDIELTEQQPGCTHNLGKQEGETTVRCNSRQVDCMSKMFGESEVPGIQDTCYSTAYCIHYISIYSQQPSCVTPLLHCMVSDASSYYVRHSQVTQQRQQ